VTCLGAAKQRRGETRLTGDDAECNVRSFVLHWAHVFLLLLLLLLRTYLPRLSALTLAGRGDWLLLLSGPPPRLPGLPLMYTLHDSLHQALLKIDVWFRDI